MTILENLTNYSVTAPTICFVNFFFNQQGQGHHLDWPTVLCWRTVVTPPRYVVGRPGFVPFLVQPTASNVGPQHGFACVYPSLCNIDGSVKALKQINYESN